MNKVYFILIALFVINITKSECQIIILKRQQEENNIATNRVNIYKAFETLKRSGDKYYFLEVKDKQINEEDQIKINTVISNSLEPLSRDSFVNEDNSIRNTDGSQDFLIKIIQSKTHDTKEFTIFRFDIFKVSLFKGNIENSANHELVKEILPFHIPKELDDEMVIDLIQNKLRVFFPYEPTIEELGKEDSTSWQKVVNTNKIKSYWDYIYSHPSGKHIGEARQKIKIIEDLIVQGENDEWDRANDDETKTSFKKYIKLYPKGKYIIIAKNNIKQLNKRIYITITGLVTITIGGWYAYSEKRGEFDSAKDLYKIYLDNRSPDEFRTACPECGTRSETYDTINDIRKNRRNAIYRNGSVAIIGFALFYFNKKLIKLDKSDYTIGVSQNNLSFSYKF